MFFQKRPGRDSTNSMIFIVAIGIGVKAWELANGIWLCNGSLFSQS